MTLDATGIAPGPAVATLDGNLSAWEVPRSAMSNRKHKAMILPQNRGNAVVRGPNGQVTVNIQARPEVVPEKSFYADVVVVEPSRDGVVICFGKLEPGFLSGGENRLAAVLELSFPYKQFYNQLYKSVVSSLEPGRPPFRDSVNAAVEKLRAVLPAGEQKGLRSTESTKTASFRVNAAIMSLLDDDAAVDFYYLDAMALRAVQLGAALGEVRGLIRVVLSPVTLKQFLDRSVEEAERLPDRIPGFLPDQPLAAGDQS